MFDPRVIFRPLENVPSDLMRPPPKITSSPIPSKNFSESPNKSFDKENNIADFTYKTLSFGSFKPELTENSCKFNDDISEKCPIEEMSKDPPAVGKFQILMEQNMRLIEIVNESFEEKELWKSKCEVMENVMKEKQSLLEKKTNFHESQQLNYEHLKDLQEDLREIKGYFYQKLGEVLRENEDLKKINNELIMKTRGLEEELEFKRDLIEKFEVELVNTKVSVRDLNDIFIGLAGKKRKGDILDRDEEVSLKEFEENMKEMLKENKELWAEHERLLNLNEEKERQIKFLQEKLTENQDFQMIRDQLTKKAGKYNSLKIKYNLETDTLKNKLDETQKELISLKNKYQFLFKESNERIQTLSLHYEESQKSFETEIEKSYDEEKNRLMSCLMEERKESHSVIGKLQEKLKDSEKEINDLKDNINMELEELSGKYSLQQEKYKEKENQMVNEIKRLNVKN